MHGMWRDAVRTPLKSLRTRLRRVRAARSDGGVAVSVDHATVLKTTTFDGGFPPPLAQCVVVEAAEYRTRAHPLSVNPAGAEAVHYAGHSVRAPALTLEHLVDQYWFPALGLLVSEQGRVWRHSFLGPFQAGFLSSIKAIVDRPLPDGTRQPTFYPERLQRAPRIAEPRLLVANSEKPNYGHWLLDIAPLIDLGARHAMPMLSWTLKPWQRALIARLDVPDGFIREIRPQPLRLDHAIVSNRHSGGASQNAHPQHRQVFGRILANVRKAARPVESPRRVLIVRSLANSRNIINRGEMVEALKRLGFAAVQPEKLSFDEQVLTFANAEIVVCEFGAAMTNIVFCAPGAKVVEIIAEGQHDPWSAHLAAMLELEHIVLFQPQSAEALEAAPRHAKDSQFAYGVDVVRLAATVRALIED
jgi:capsular polysaccharide biosynthesis protein